MASLAPGEVLDGRYEVLRPLGAGGMGEVFIARRLALGDLVAIKRLLAAQDTADNRARFLGEARAAAHIHHPNVVRVFDFGAHGGEGDAVGSPYLVMEYLDGPTLGDELTARGRLGADEALALFTPMCAAIEAGHRRHVVHRDLKPANVILARADDGSRVVKVLDFGLAVMEARPGARLTTPGTIVGTCSYMAPEQVAGLPALPATDLFALGVILYEMVTGMLPFTGDTQMAVMFKISQGSYRPARAWVDELPPAIDDAITAALQLDPALRPASAEQLAAIAHGQIATRSVRPASSGRGAARAGGDEPTAVVQAPASHLAPGAKRFDSSVRKAQSTPRLDTFVGRAAELARLDDELRESIAGRGHLVLVVGDEGAGRTRVVEAFARKAAAGGAVVLAGRFFDDASRPPLFDAFVRMLAGSQKQLPGAASADALVQAAALADREPAFAAVADAVAGRAGSRPLIITLDDLHLARKPELELVDHLQRTLASRGILIIGTASAAAVRAGGELATWQGGHVQRRSGVVLRLRPFGVPEIRAFLDAAFGAVHARPRDLRRLDAAAGGNPLFLAEVVRHLMAIGAARRRDAEWALEVPDDLEVPATVAALVEARTQTLEPELLGVLELCAAAGDELRFDVLLTASGLEEDRLDALLERAVDDGLLTRDGVSDGHDYRWRGTLLRAALIARSSPRARKKAHRRVLDALLARPEKDPARSAHALAAHHAALDQLPEAFAFAVQALGEAVERGQADVAEVALAHARAAGERLAAAGAPPDDAARARLDYLGGTVMVRVGRIGEARALLGRASELARRVGDAPLAIDVELELAQGHVALGDLAGAIETARRAVAASRQLGDGLRAARGELTLSFALLRRGLSTDATELLDRLAALELPAVERGWVHRNRAWLWLKQGEFAIAHAEAERALAIARGAGDPLLLTMALNARAAVASESGDNAAGRALHEEALELARRASLRRAEAIELANVGEACHDEGELERALGCFQEALSIFVDIEDRACEGDCRVNVGRSMLALGDAAGAKAMLERARELCEATGRGEYAALALLYLADVKLGETDASGARALAADARERLDKLRSHLAWRAEHTLAQAALLDGDRERARYHGRRAVELVDAQRAQMRPGSTDGFDRVTRAVRDLVAELDG